MTGVQTCALPILVQANSASFFVNLFAAWDLGACVVPVSINSTEMEINFILDHSGASHVYRQGSFHRLEPAVSGPPRNSALLMYTSGSTGAPKGVLLDWPALESKIRTIATVLTDQALERTLCVLPVSFGHGLIGNSLPALYLGCDLLIEPAFSTEMAQCFGEFLDARGITFFSSVPSLWSSVLPFAAPPISKKIRSAFCASADLSVANWKSVKNWLGSQVDFRNVYGITEAGSWISALPAGVEYREPGLVGSGWNCEFRIDPANQEILVKAPYVMRG